MAEGGGKRIVVKDGEWAARLENVTLVWKSENGASKKLGSTNENGRCILAEMPDKGQVSFQKKGYVTKHYSARDLPSLVRLISINTAAYQDRLWYYPGESVNARIHSASPYRATLYRHGIDKEEISRFQNLPSLQQKLPDKHFVENGLNWECNLTYTIPPQARPGLYSLKIQPAKEGLNDFAIPYLVSTPHEQHGESDILVLASTNNWICYNIWGGRNRYRNFEDGVSDPYLRDPGPVTELLAWLGKKTPDPLVRTAKRLLGMPPSNPDWKLSRLTIQRPFTNCALEQDEVRKPFTNHLAAGEWRVLAWLEREGFDYDIVSGFELHKKPDMLEKYKAIILSTHCEYWSENMYFGLKQAHENYQLSILNLSGNSIYREVEFFEDGSLRCASLKFEDSVEDETRLIGVRFTEGDLGTCAPYKIEMPDHWAFEGLQVSSGQRFGHTSLNRPTKRSGTLYDPGRPGTVSGLQGEGASGWETDKLSATAPDGFLRIAKGENRWGGADMVIREQEGSRGGVFSASSITFGGSLLIDDFTTVIVKNTLNRFL